jgi:hypothetical protein
MPYCPNCRSEFQNWVKVCPDCEVALVAELSPLPPKVKKPDDSIMPVATAPNEIEAQLWEGILKDEGIRCLLSSGSSGAAAQGHPFNVPITVFVLASEVKSAKEILAPFLQN